MVLPDTCHGQANSPVKGPQVLLLDKLLSVQVCVQEIDGILALYPSSALKDHVLSVAGSTVGGLARDHSSVELC